MAPWSRASQWHEMLYVHDPEVKGLNLGVVVLRDCIVHLHV